MPIWRCSTGRGLRLVRREQLEERLTLEQWRQPLGWRLRLWLAETVPDRDADERAGLLDAADSELEQHASQLPRTRLTTYVVVERTS
jgi:hypothetical protein